MSNINWPDHLVEDIARGRCILFIGAGVSASAQTPSGVRPKDWKTFLEHACRHIPIKKDNEFVKKLIKQGQYLIALQCVFDLVNRGTYYGIIEQEFKSPDYIPSEVHKAIAALDPKCVITTNFDFIYAKALPAHAVTPVVYNNCSNFADVIRSNDKVLVYAHGNVNDIGTIVFTKKQYYNAKKNNPEFYDVLQALFITNTVLFLGCGLNDPDINLILENVNIKTNASKPHYNVTLKGNHSSIIRDWENSYNISTLEYGPSYSDLKPNLDDLKNLVDSYRLSHGIII